MKKTTVLAALAAFVMIGAAGAHADDHEGGMKRFEDADKNSDGIVSHDEMLASVQAKFSEFDKNGDGYIELAELPKEMPVPEHMKERIEKRKAEMSDEQKERFEKKMENREKRKPSRIDFVARMDRDGDEKISLEEFSKRAVQHFKRADQNGDGEVSKAEAEAVKHHRDMKKGKQGHKGGGHHGAQRG